jgi:hypothetical protein
MAGYEGLWRLECEHCSKETLEELDKLLVSCKFFDTQNENDLLTKVARDLRTTVVTVSTVGGQQRSVTVLGLGDSTSLSDLIAFIKVHGVEVTRALS